MSISQNTQEMSNKNDFNKYLIAKFLSKFGCSFTNVALTIYIHKTFKNLFLTGTFLFIAFVPKLILYPIINKIKFGNKYKNLMSTLDLISGFIIMVLVIKLNLYTLFFLYLAFSTIGYIDSVYTMDFFREITTNEELNRRQGLINISSTLSMILGPLLAGIVINRFSINAAFIIDGITYFVSAVIIKSMSNNITIKYDNTSESSNTINEKYKSIKLNINTIIVKILIIVFFGGIISLLTIDYITNKLMLSADYYGIIMAAIAVGSTISSLLIANSFVKRNLKIISNISLVISGIMLFLILLQPQFISLLVILFFCGIFNSFALMYYNIEFMILCQNNKQRQNISLFNLLLDGTESASKPVGGFADKHIGTIPIFLFTGVLFIVISVTERLKQGFYNLNKNICK